MPDVAPFVEVYLAAPLPQQQPNSRIASIDGSTDTVETTMSIEDLKAENMRIASHHGAAEKRPQSGVSRADRALQTCLREHAD